MMVPVLRYRLGFAHSGLAVLPNLGAMSQNPTTIHLVRHGEVHNPGEVLYERAPGFHLSDRGRAMAERVAGYFAAFPKGTIGALYASPLERAQETAAPLAKVLDLDVQTDPAVIEAQSFFAGMKLDIPNLLKPRNLVRLRNPKRPTWGEPFTEIVARARGAIDRARAAVPGGSAVIVSHQSPIWHTRLSYEGRPIWHMPHRRECSLASITTLVFDDGGLAQVGYHEPAADLLPNKLL
jgi:broad specificity phosphatase PhoE